MKTKKLQCIFEMLLIFKIHKNGIKKNISKLLGAFMLVLALSFSTSSYAVGQSSDSDSSGDSDSSVSSVSSDSSGKPSSVPLDGGLSILLLGAAAFGIKKLRDNK